MRAHENAFNRSRLPLYAQVASLLRRRIETGEWIPGQKLPTLEELEREYRVARVTARQAVALLDEEGLVWRKQGKGTFVARGLGEQRWLHLATEWSTLLQMIEGTTMRIIGVGPAAQPPRLTSADGRAAIGYQHIHRVHAKGEQPYCIISLYIARPLYERAPREFQSRLALAVLSEMSGVRIEAARQTLTVGRADFEAADLLEVEVGAPVAEVRRVITDPSGTVIYFAEIVYRGDFIKLDIDLLGASPTNEGVGK